MTSNQTYTPADLEIKFKINNSILSFRYIGLAFLGFILIRNLWVSDDAFITLRTVDNFLNGYGLVWNVGERVQVFTHPLWMFLLIPMDYFFADPMYGFYLIALLLSLWTFYILFNRFATSLPRILFLIIVMGGSMSFIDFSSSGLENPLTHLLIVGFLVIYFQEGEVSPKRLFQLSLLAGLAVFNRMDTLIIFLPALLQLFLSQNNPKWKTFLWMVAGFIPFILWELFATFYYGFPFPNTYYVKAVTGLPLGYLFKQGIAYIENSYHWDPLTLGTVFFGMVTALLQREAKRSAVALGSLFYLVYILWEGGDFMSGRFFSGIFLLGLFLLLTFDFRRFFGEIAPQTQRLLFFLLVMVALSAERPPLLTYTDQPGIPDDQYGIANEKGYYFNTNSFLNYVRTGYPHELIVQGRKAAVEKTTPIDSNTIGMFGYFAGPEIYIIDTYALADPLRAHLPINGPSRIGHYERSMPAGYRETINSGFKENLIEDSNLHMYFDRLSILVRGDLFAPGRIREIICFNTGYYDHLVEKYWLSYLASQ